MDKWELGAGGGRGELLRGVLVDGELLSRFGLVVAIELRNGRGQKCGENPC